jgi:hypothetical protein
MLEPFSAASRPGMCLKKLCHSRTLGAHASNSVQPQSNSRGWLHCASPRKRHQMRNLYDLTCILAKQVLFQLSYTPIVGYSNHFPSLTPPPQPFVAPKILEQLGAGRANPMRSFSASSSRNDKFSLSDFAYSEVMSFPRECPAHILVRCPCARTASKCVMRNLRKL